VLLLPGSRCLSSRRFRFWLLLLLLLLLCFPS
jgi:hypothetical protein